MITKEEIIALLQGYGIRRHYIASRDASRTMYALFHGGKQVGEPSSHAGIVAFRDNMIAASILEKLAQ